MPDICQIYASTLLLQRNEGESRPHCPQLRTQLPGQHFACQGCIWKTKPRKFSKEYLKREEILFGCQATIVEKLKIL